MIDFQTLSVSERCKEVFEKEKSHLKDELNMSLVLSHFGYFSQDLVNGFTEGIEEILISAGEKKQIQKRVFSILIEGLQNIRFHGEKDDQDKFYGLFILAKNQDKIVIYFGNLLNAENKDSLNERLKALNSLEEEDVKEHYMSVLSNGIISAKGNAGLGFITMRLKSKSKLNYQFYAVSEALNLFTVEIHLNKEI